jgi:hypothetical protein
VVRKNGPLNGEKKKYAARCCSNQIVWAVKGILGVAVEEFERVFEGGWRIRREVGIESSLNRIDEEKPKRIVWIASFCGEGKKTKRPRCQKGRRKNKSPRRGGNGRRSLTVGHL